MDIFRSFCDYVDERIFSKENMGSYVALVVDQSFIDDFCKENHTTEVALMSSVRSNHRKNIYDHLDAKGIIAIQLFAASKRAYSGGLTPKAYYARLSQVVGLNEDYISKEWMPSHQDKIWSLLYKWCNKNHFRITENERRSGSYCYVQYPLTQAKRVFTDEDLLYIAKLFVDKHLYPGEDITQVDFWKILNRKWLDYYLETNHAKEVINNSISAEDYLSQIYNFYLRWNGKYKIREREVCTDSKLNNVFAYITDDLTFLELRDENLNLLCNYLLSDIKYSDFEKKFHFKREGILLFKKDDIYDNRWQEVRYIDANEDDYTKQSGMYGIAVFFRDRISIDFNYRMSKKCEVLFENRNVIIYKIIRCHLTEIFFTKKRAYEIFGGLKIGRNTYLKGATPILRLLKPTMVWIDGKALKEIPVEGNYSLNHLDVGSHFIKLPDMKKIKIDVVDTSASVVEWQENYNNWQIGKEPAIWNNGISETGIVGLDFSCASDFDEILDASVTKRGAKALVFGEYHKRENNIAINLTK